GEHVAGPQRPVVLVVLLGVQATASAAATAPAALGAHDAGGVLARAEPGLAHLGPQEVVRVELGRGLDERGRGDDAAGLGLLGRLLVGIDGIIVADRAGEHEDMAGLYGKSLGGHGAPPMGSAS